MTKKISVYTVAAIVVANMIGTGVFTSLGFQLASVKSSFTILALWLIGGVLSLFGAFAYAELGTQFKESGGDYIYLSRLFHPLLGYLSAWTGMTAGFSAPVAVAAMAFTHYLAPFGPGDSQWLAIGVIIAIAFLHSFTTRHSARLQNSSTLVKVLFILALIGIAFAFRAYSNNALDFGKGWSKELVTPGFAVSMIYVGFAYTGWNAAAYVADEIADPAKNIPRALIGSTLFVTAVYVLFQFGLLRHAGITQMVNREAVTAIAFENVLGQTGAKWVSAFIAFQLVATISSYLWVGPRVTQAMAKEFKLWRPLAVTNTHRIPVRAVWLHAGISIILTLTGSFDRILLYAGFVLQLMSSLTVASSLMIRKRNPGAFKSPLKPLLQVIFLAFNLWVLVYTVIDRPRESLAGLGILGVGAIIFFFDADISRKEPK